VVSDRSSDSRLRETLAGLPLVGRPVLSLALRLRRLTFPGSGQYWEDRYRSGRSGGPAGRGIVQEFKASVLNEFVRAHDVRSVIELGCGDGVQLALADYPRYLGLDVSVSALRLCIERFATDPTKSFLLYDPAVFADRAGFLSADLSLAVDVVYHLVEDRTYDLTMRHLFSAGRRFVIVSSSNVELEGQSPHVRHRRFTRWVEENAPEWELVDTVMNPYHRGADAVTSIPKDFYMFGRRTEATGTDTAGESRLAHVSA
jgi:hypothetical protein